MLFRRCRLPGCEIGADWGVGSLNKGKCHCYRELKGSECMKKYKLLTIFILIVILTIGTCYAGIPVKKESSEYMDCLVNTTAIRQLNAPVFVLDYCGSKYILNLKVKGKNANSLMSLDSGKVLYRFQKRIALTGYCNGLIYYTSYGNHRLEGSLEYFDLRSMQPGTIDCRYKVDPFLASVYTASGQIYIPLQENSDGFHYAAVLDNRILGYEEQACVLQIGNCRYYMIVPDPFIRMTNLYTTEQIVLIDEHDQELLIDLGKSISTPIGVYGVNDQCIIYCDQGEQILYVLDSDHKPMLVFSCECIHSETAMALQGTNCILSVKRFEQLGRTGYGYRRYENDSFEGTYLINLLDMSNRKISDRIFCGLFCPDESKVYGCDEAGDIYLIHYSGESERVFAQGP